MYKYNLVISIFSDSLEIENIIKNIEPLNNYTHEIKTYNKLDFDAINKSQIVIWDLNDLNNLKDVVEKDTKLILCVNEFNDDDTFANEIIIKPFKNSLLEHSFKKVLNLINLEDEKIYINTCLDTTINAIPDMYWIKSLDGIHTLLNDEFCDVVGKTKEDVTGKDHYYIWNVSKDDPNSGADICKKTEDQVIAAGHTLSFQESVKSLKGTRQLVTYKSPLYDKFGCVIGTVGLGHDITDLNNMGVEIQILLDSVPYAVLIRNNEGFIEKVNSYFETYFHISESDVIGKLYQDWAGETFGSNRTNNERGFVEGKFTIDDEEKQVELRFSNIVDVFDNVTGQVCIFRDVTLERKLQAQIIESSNIDYMTKLYNRRYLYKYISNQNQDEVVTVFSIDLDHFKSVNDTYGHKAGDNAIILAANTIRDYFKNDLVVRMGGDEFLVVKMGSISKDEIGKDATKLLENFVNNFNKEEMFKVLTASIGIAQGFLNDGIEKIIHKSDDALYNAKENGKNCFVIHK